MKETLSKAEKFVHEKNYSLAQLDSYICILVSVITILVLIHGNYCDMEYVSITLALQFTSGRMFITFFSMAELCVYVI